MTRRPGYAPAEPKAGPGRAAGQPGPGEGDALRYRLCPRCFRAVPAHSGERFCINDGTRMLDACPGCGTAIASPYSRFCAGCGRPLAAPSPSTPT